MSRNAEYRFGQHPKANIARSTFNMKKNIKGTFNTGELIPFYVNQDILPGDTFKIKQSIVVRMLTPIYPTMDNLVLDTYYFSVPYRLVWDNFKKAMGENENGAWAQQTEYEVPQIKITYTASTAGNTIPTIKSIWAYMGLPINVKPQTGSDPDISLSALPFRAYAEIYNYFFRNQNLIAPITVHKDDTTRSFLGTVTEQGGTILKASKLSNYFTTCTPAPQKGNPVSIPIGTSAPVLSNGTVPTFSSTGTTDGAFTNQKLSTKQATLTSNHFRWMTAGTATAGNDISRDTIFGNNSGLYADLSNATAATINALRLAFQTQKILEKDIRGTFYTQILYNHFGVISPDGRQQRPEYIGGKRINLQMNQVAQTSSTDNTSPQGNVAAFSLTADVHQAFTKSFTEHSIIMGIMVVRQLVHTTQQGIPKQWSRRKRLDFYWPELAHLGEQPVYNKEICVLGSTTDEQVFGYQERWAEYKYEENVICGEMKSTYSTPLDSWHYGDLYSSLPTLSQNWIEETKVNVDRTLAVQNHDQFLFDTELYIQATRPIPVYCTPGLIDHF